MRLPQQSTGETCWNPGVFDCGSCEFSVDLPELPNTDCIRAVHCLSALTPTG